MTINYPYWNNDEVISSDKLNSMVQAIINGDPMAVKVSNATKNDVNQIVSYLSSLHNSAKTNLNSATSTSNFDTAYTNMTALVSNKLGSYANDDTVDLYSTGIRASIITFLQAYDSMMSSDRLNNKNTDNTLNSRIDNETKARSDADTSINNSLNAIKANGGGRNLLQGTGNATGDVADGNGTVVKGIFNGYDAVKTIGAWTGHYFNQKSALSRTNINIGDWVTISVYVKAEKESITEGNLNAYRVNGGHLDQINMSDKPITTEWQQYSWSYQINADSLNCEDTRIEYSNNTDDNWIYWAGWMIERGVVAHDWSPAPEDVEAEITTLNGKTMQNRGTVSSPDFNTLMQAGYYTITNPSTGQNYPTTNWGTLEVSGQVADVNGRLNQRYVSDSGGTIYTRQYNNGTKGWTAWNHMANTNDVDAKIDNLQIGGRNLLVGTQNLDGEGWRVYQGTWNKSDFQGLTSISNTVAWGGMKYYTSVLEKQGKLISTSTQYVLSVWINNTGTSAVDIHLNSSEIDLNDTMVTTLPANSGWVRIASKPFRFTKTTGLSDNLSFNTPSDVQGGVLKQAGLKLEIGNVATEWSPAPEDFDIYTSGRTITLPHHSSITIKDDRIVSQVYLPRYFTDHTAVTNLDYLADHGEWNNLFIPSATMATLTSRPTNPDTNTSLTGDCFFSNHYAYSGTTIRAFQKIYSCDYNYVFIRSYNGSSKAWSNWSCLTPYA